MDNTVLNTIKKTKSRESIIVSTSILGIAVNLLIACSKIIIGFLTASIAIISEGVNNASDVLTSVITLIGTKLAKKHPDEDHPFGHGRIEYLAGLLIAVLILVTGIELIINSFKLIFNPVVLNISYVSLIIVAVSAIIKFVLGIYTLNVGKKVDSGALIGVGKDCRNDSFASIITIVSAGIFLLFDFSVDAYAGIITSVIVIKAGIEVLFSTLSELIGRPGEKELAKKLYKEIRETKYVINAADMMLHNYGPNSYSGSVNLEIDHEKTIGEVYEILHKLQLHIMHDYNVTMVFGLYAVDNDHEEVKQIRKDIVDFIKEQEHIKSFHAVYLEPETNKIYCDFIVDYKIRDWEGLKKQFLDYMSVKYPNNEVELTIETEFV